MYGPSLYKIYTPHSRSYPQTSISSPSEMTTDELTSEAGQQSAHSLSGLLQDLTKELQKSSPFPITCGGFGDIYKCQLVRPDGTVPVRPVCALASHIFLNIMKVAVKTIRALQSDNEALMRKNRKVMPSSIIGVL